MNCIAEICAMQTLVIAATLAEIKPFVNKHPGADVLVTGIGVPSTIYALQKRIQQKKYSCILQAGIAGSFTKTLGLTDTVLVGQDCFGDIGMEEKGNFTPVFNSGFVNPDEFPFSAGWLINEHPLLKATTLPVAKAITVNKVSDSHLQTSQFEKIYNTDIETMEGAAFHYVCLQENIPFLQIRSVSNFVGERDKTKWQLKGSIENLNTVLTEIYFKITDKL